MHGISTFWYRLVIDFLLDFGDLVAKDEVEAEVLVNFLDAVHDGGVIFNADFGGNFGGAETEFFGKEVHGDLTGGLDVRYAGFATHFFRSELEIAGDFVDDLFGIDRVGAGGFIDGNGAVFDKFKWGEAADFGHEEDGGEFAFEVANVGVDVFGDVFDGFWFDIGAHEFGFGAKDGAFIFKLGELQVEGAGPGETGSKAFVDGFNLAREAIGSDDDLFIELVEVIEDIEEFFLGFFFTDNELEIVDDEDVEFAEFEIEFVAFAKADGIDEVGVEVSDGSVEDFEGRVFTEKFVADGLDEMGFAEARSTIEEEWVVAFAWGVDDATSGGNSKVIIGADDEII